MSLFRAEAIAERRRKVHGTIILSRPLSTHLMTWVIVGCTVATIAFLASFEFQRKETVRGYITSSKGVIALRARTGGLLSEVFVRAGDTVSAGDPVFEVTTDIESAHGMTRNRQLATTEDGLREIDAQLSMTTAAFADRRRFLERQRTGLEAQIRHLQAQLALKRQILEVNQQNLERARRLGAERFASDIEVAGELEQVLNHESGVAVLDNRISEKESLLRSAVFELEGLPLAQARDVSELTLRKSALQQARLEHSAQRRYRVRSPVAGRIGAIRSHVGQELAAQSSLVTVLPEDASLVANLLAPSRAIGFLARDGVVNLLIDAFPYQKFGVQTGRIREISRSADNPGDADAPFAHAESVYRIVVELDRDYVFAYGRRYPLQVDMLLRGDLVVDRRSLLDWMLEPLKAARL